MECNQASMESKHYLINKLRPPCLLAWTEIKENMRINVWGVEINAKKIAFGNKEHTTDQEIGVSVLLKLFISSNEVCNTAYAL